MVACHQFSLRIKHHISIILVTTVRGTLGITGIAWLLVPNICHNVDRVFLGQAAESFLQWSMAKSGMRYRKRKEKKSRLAFNKIQNGSGLNLLSYTKSSDN